MNIRFCYSIVSFIVFICPLLFIGFIVFKNSRKKEVRRDTFFVALLFSMIFLAASEGVNFWHSDVSELNNVLFFSPDYEYLSTIIKLFAFSILFSGMYEAIKKIEI